MRLTPDRSQPPQASASTNSAIRAELSDTEEECPKTNDESSAAAHIVKFPESEVAEQFGEVPAGNKTRQRRMPPSTRAINGLMGKVAEQRKLVATTAGERCVVPPQLAHKCIEIDLSTLLSGVYLLIQDRQIVYVGSSVSVAGRLGNHAREERKVFNRAIFLPVHERHLLEVEGALIRFFRPEYNGPAPAYTGRDDRILKSLGLPKMDPELRKLMSMKARLSRMRAERREFHELDLRERLRKFGDYSVPGDQRFRGPTKPRVQAPNPEPKSVRNENTFIWRGKVRSA